MESLFNTVKSELKEAKRVEEAVNGKNDLVVKLMAKNWCQYDTDDIKQLVLEAARTIGFDENDVKISHEYLSQFCEIHGEDEVVYIKINVHLQ